MKTIKLLSAAILIAFSFSFITQEPDAEKLRMDYAVKAYIDAISSGKVKAFAEIVDKDAKFTISRGEKIINYTRSEMLGFMKNSENVVQNCETDYTVVEQTSSQAIVKVTMKYEAFSRINYITIAQTNNGWKITNVSTVFV